MWRSPRAAFGSFVASSHLVNPLSSCNHHQCVSALQMGTQAPTCLPSAPPATCSVSVQAGWPCLHDADRRQAPILLWPPAAPALTVEEKGPPRVPLGLWLKILHGAHLWSLPCCPGLCAHWCQDLAIPRAGAHEAACNQQVRSSFSFVPKGSDCSFFCFEGIALTTDCQYEYFNRTASPGART